MKTLKPLLAVISIIGAMALVAQVSSAQPTGSLTNQITGSTNVLWDFGQLSNELQNIQFNLQSESHGQTNEVDVTFSAPYTQNGKGKLAGSGTNQVVLVTDNNGPQTNTFTGTYVSKGSVTSSKGVAHLTFSVTVSGKTVLGDDVHPAKLRAVVATANYTVKVDAKAGQVSGRVAERASAAGLGTIADTQALSGPIPSELGNGTWTLVLNFGAANKNKLTGTASVTLATGQVYPFNFTGNLNPRNSQSKLNLKGTGAGTGSILQVTLQTNQVTRIVGQVSGQSVNIKQ